MPPKEIWAGIGSVLAFILGLFSMAMNHEKITLCMNKIRAFFSPYIEITIPEYDAEHFERSDFYVAIEAYLSEHCATAVRKLKAELGSHRKKPLLYVDDGQQIIDIFPRPRGDGSCDGGGGGNDGGGSDGDGGGDDGGGGGGGRATLWWHAYKEKAVANAMYRPGVEERRIYRVSFHRRFRKSVEEKYLPHVIKKGRDAIANKRQRRLFTNNPNSTWSYVAFQHPATFETLAMDPKLRKDIIDDLNSFRKRKKYYAKVGKPWKRGYLLFGPPGTGKSTMVSAMANYLNYDIYDLELTAVKSNNQLRRLFIETTGKSIIVIEDIDRSVDLTGGRREDKNNQPMKREEEVAENDGIQQLTLSGLLNFIDGLWSACGGERIIIFTTNNKDKLDPALIRPGRMDMEIEMSYCSYEAFEVLARNYLEIDENQLYKQFGEIQRLLEVVKITPADVAEHLMRTEKDAGARLEGLIRTLKEKAEGSKEEREHDQEE